MADVRPNVSGIYHGALRVEANNAPPPLDDVVRQLHTVFAKLRSIEKIHKGLHANAVTGTVVIPGSGGFDGQITADDLTADTDAQISNIGDHSIAGYVPGEPTDNYLAFWDGTLGKLGAISPASVGAVSSVSSGGDGIAVSPTTGAVLVSPDDDLAAIEALTGTGIPARTAADTWAMRNVAGTTDRIDVTNPAGTAGDPTIDIASTYAGQASITTVGTIGTGTWNGSTLQVGYGGTGRTSLTSDGYVTGAGASAVGGITGSDQVAGWNGTTPSAISAGSGVTISGGTISATGSGGTVTDVTATSPISSSGGATPNITHDDSAVTPGSHTYASVTVDQKGHVTAVSSGTSPVTSVGASSPLSSSGGATPTISIGSTIQVADGGTGRTTLTASAILLGAGTSAIGALPISTAEYPVKMNAGGTAFEVAQLATAGIADDAVTYAKIQDVSATDKLLGRSTAGAGVIEEIACTSFARTILDDADAATVRATIGAGTGTIGGSTGATDNRILRSDGTGAATVQNSAVTLDDTGNVIPVTDAAQDLGSSSIQWRLGWVDQVNEADYAAFSASSVKYYAGNIVYYDHSDTGKEFYICIANHTSSATNDPVVGSGGVTYWRRLEKMNRYFALATAATEEPTILTHASGTQFNLDNTSGGDSVFTLPTTAGTNVRAGDWWVFRATSVGTYTIDLGGVITLDADGEAVTLKFDGSEWYVESGYGVG